MPLYQDREASIFNSKPGDYILQVTGFEKGLSKGAKTSGSDKFTLKLLVEQTGSKMRDDLVMTDNKFFAAKNDCFLKSCGVKISNGQSFEFDREEAEKTGAQYVDLIGLRGWATIGYDDGDANKARPEGQKYNKVLVWITNREKLAPILQAAPEAKSETPDWS